MECRRSFLAVFYVAIIFAVTLKENTAKIPPQMWLSMRNITDIRDFMAQKLRKKPDATNNELRPEIPMENILYTEEGTLNPDGSNAIANILDVEKDECEIKRVSYEIPLDPQDHNVIYWPSCVKLDQCSGCCNNELLECAPTRIQEVSHEVLRARYPFEGAEYFEFEGVYELLFNRHLSCECRCRVQPEHCTVGLHIYEPNSCRCRCLNEHESYSCVAPKVWDNGVCGCVCPLQGRHCFNDEVYSEISCSCVPSQMAPPPNDLNQDNPCESHACRPGFSGQLEGGVCKCRLGSHNQMEGSLINSEGRSTQRPVPTRATRKPVQVEHVPNHPMFSVNTETPAPPRTRRPRPTRRPRNRPRFDNIHG